MYDVVVIGGQWFVPDEDHSNGMREVSEQERWELIRGER